MYGVVKNVLWCICAYFQTTRNMGSNWCYITSVVVMYVFWCICAYFQTTRIKFLFKRYFLTSEVVLNVFWCICAYFQTKKRVLVHLRILSDHKKHGLKLMLFNVCCGNVRVLMHLRILPDHQNQVFLKDIF